jgi:hypothetical protein
MMATPEEATPAVMAVAAAAAIATAAAVTLAATAIVLDGRFATRTLLLAAGRLVVMPTTPAAKAAATAAATEQPGVGLRLQAHDDDAHRRQTQRQSDHISFHRSTSKNEQKIFLTKYQRIRS